MAFRWLCPSKRFGPESTTNDNSMTAFVWERFSIMRKGRDGGGWLTMICGLLLTVHARADVVFSESFEGTSFGFSGMTQAANTLLYSSNYTNAAPTGAGLRYFYGGTYASGGTTTFSTSSISLTTANLSAAQIDAGLGQFNLSAWFSTVNAVNPPPDYASLSLQFKNGSGSNIGSVYTIGGQTFTQNIGTSGGKRNWGQDVSINAIPTLARQVVLTINSTTTLSSGDRDGYVDLVSLDVTAVPEPGTLLLGGIAAACGGGGVWWKRRRRQPAEEPQSEEAPIV